MTTETKIEFTAEETERLAGATRTAALGILSAWETLLQVAHRIGKDWEPDHTSVCNIAEDFAAALDHPEAVDTGRRTAPRHSHVGEGLGRSGDRVGAAIDTAP